METKKIQDYSDVAVTNLDPEKAKIVNERGVELQRLRKQVDVAIKKAEELGRSDMVKKLKARGQQLDTLLKGKTFKDLSAGGQIGGNPSSSESENDIRRRRIGFYIRNGFSPVYEMATCGMRWQALVYDEHGHTLGDIMRWHKALYGPARTDVVVPLGPDEQPEMPYWIK